ncbi:CDP-glycerol glycerophosphotransferase family protein [Pediococcus damnosus]|uniref:CDP-glycerol glycerophosphotransferase family protein n=1 Tax=Pediococcus damnosus TaxID=51663 RepID=UPI000B0ABBFF|nr:CDP-glycerol glycerophosphotransferase family protein [Pediococcus damnosus]
MRAILSDVQAQQEMQQFEVELIGLTQQAKNLRVIFIEQESLESFTIDQINLQENILEFPLTFHQLKGHFPGQTRFVWEVYLQWQVADHFETVQIENEYIETKQIDLTTFQKISGDFSGFTNIELTEKNQDAVFELHNVQRLSDRIRLVGAPKIGDQVMKNIVITVGNTDNQNNSFRLTNNISTYSDLFVFELLLTDLKVNQKYILKIAYDFEGSHIHQQVGLISEFDLSKDFATDANGQTVFLEKSYDNVISLTRLEKSSKFSTITQSLVNKTQRLLSASGVLATKLKLLWIKRLFKRSRSPFVKPTIVFESFGGRQVSDSPLAIYRVFKEFYPSYNLVWAIYPELKAFCREHGIRYVVRNSAKWVNLMCRAQCWVSNARYPSWVKKSKFTFYLQTWHGTPLKKLGLDIKQVTMPGTDTASYHRNFTREANRWDALISPNDYSTNIFRSAFGYKNQVLKLGYPRNDELLQATPEQITQLKQSMGIPANKKVVLYAPTYRNNSYISTGITPIYQLVNIPLNYLLV